MLFLVTSSSLSADLFAASPRHWRSHVLSLHHPNKPLQIDKINPIGQRSTGTSLYFNCVRQMVSGFSMSMFYQDIRYAMIDNRNLLNVKWTNCAFQNVFNVLSRGPQYKGPINQRLSVCDRLCSVSAATVWLSVCDRLCSVSAATVWLSVCDRLCSVSAATVWLNGVI